MKPSWWEQKKHEWLYKQEIRRKQRRARKYAKLQAKEAERAQREMRGGGPSLGKRYAEWQRRRALKKEQQAEFWAQLQQKHPFLGWLKRHETKFFWLASLCVVAAVGIFITREMQNAEQKAAATAEDKRVMARVNGIPIYVDTLMNRLFFANGATVLQELTEQEVVKQKAESEGLELSLDEKNQIQKLIDNNPRWRIAAPRLERDLLLKRLILREVDEKRKKEVYKDFRDDLTTYVVASIAFESKKKAEIFLEALEEGKSLEQASSELSLDAKPPHRIGEFTASTLNQYLGAAAEKTIRKLQPGQFSRPLYLGGNVVVFRLDGVRKEYKDVQPAIEALIVEAESQQFLYKLMGEADIESPFVNPDNALFKDDTPGPYETPSPSASPTEASNEKE